MREDWRVLRNNERDLIKPYGMRTIGAPAGEPISLADAWAHLKIDTFGSPPASDDDAWLTTTGIPGARDWCEQYIGGSIAPQTIELAAQGFPIGFVPLPFGPVLSMVSVIYTDADGIDQTMTGADYALDPYERRAKLRLAYGATWPTARASTNSVRIRYVAGFSLADDSPQINPLPAGIRAAILLILGHLYENRENTIAEERITIQEVPMGAASLLEKYRLRLSMA